MNSNGVDSSHLVTNNNPPAPAAEFTRLRRLLLGADYEALFEFKACLSDPGRYHQHLADVVTEAIALRDQKDASIAGLFTPVVERSLTESVKTNPEPIAEALYPIMGPAIRKSISDTMNQALENFNKALEQSLSLRAMKWRFDAVRSGRSYAEIAMLNTLDYQVEQVFLIHRDTSLLLHHRVAETAIVKDADMVSSMLSAIQDFVSDSFSVDSDDELDTLRLGALTVCIESGPKAALAAVVHGSVPENLRSAMHESLESVHRSHWRYLADFSGDAEPFNNTQSVLDSCMLSQRQDSTPVEKKKPWLAVAAMSVLTCAFGYWQWTEYETGKQWNQALQQLENEPGIVVIDSEKTDEGYQVFAMKDSLARDPQDIIGNDRIQSLGIQFTFEPYYALHSDFTTRRVSQLLVAPKGITVSVNANTLQVSGNASEAWASSIGHVAAAIPGIQRIDTTKLVIEATPVLAAALPAESIHDRILRLKRNLEAAVFYFDSGNITPDIDSIRRVQNLVGTLEELADDVDSSGGTIRLIVKGFSDTSGAKSVNLKISKKRADTVLELFRQQITKSITAQSVGMGSLARADGVNARQARLAVNISY